MVREIIQQGISQQLYSGAVYSVWQNGIEKHSGAVGVADRESKEEMTVEHLFDLASVTKLFTTTLILRHISNNLLKLEDTLATFQIGPQEISDISIRQLLMHRSGLVAWYPFYEDKMDGLKFEEVLQRLQILRPHSTHEVVYSDLNFMLLQTVCERIDSRSFEQQMYDILFELGDKDAFFGQATSTQLIVASEYGNQIEQKMCAERGLSYQHWRAQKKAIKGEINDGNCHYFFNGVSGHAGLFGSKDTLLKLGQLYLKGGGSLIDAEFVKQVFLDEEGGRTLGFSKEGMFNNGIGHTGFTGTMLYIEPTSNLIIVLLTNRLHVDTPRDISEIRKKLIDSIH
ncbi:serine hydrolase domain-containing protein [Solibacillus daqui]|uniref:serine hydrolase domain-containing protein n=1 Tax=Solibacillus daqui TaxID=2912187 RepID=UPI002365618F|nr:serine hydrolase domain-containing protein [Solibacillus daqui]